MLQAFGQTIYSLNTLCIDEDDGYIIAGSGLGYVYVWDEQSGDLVKSIRVSDNSISSSFIQNKKLYLSTFKGELIKVDLLSWQIQKLGEFNNIEVYDILPTDNHNIIVSGRRITNSSNQIGLSFFDLTSSKPSTQFFILAETSKYNESYFNHITSLQLKYFGKNQDKFTLMNCTEFYSIENNKLKSNKTKLGLQLEKDGYQQNLNESFWSYSDFMNFGIHYFSNDLAYICDNDMFYRDLYRLNDLTYINQACFLEKEIVEDIGLQHNLSIIRPEKIMTDIETFRSANNIDDGRIIPIIQNNFQFFTDYVLDENLQKIAIGNESHVIKVFDLKKKQLVTNLIAYAKIIRIAKHPFAPLIATLQIDGSIYLWDFENYKLLAKYQAIDIHKFKKYHKKTYGKYHKDDSPLLFAKKLINEGDIYPIVFDFSELGDEIRFFQWGINEEFNLFNRVNFLTGKISKYKNPALDNVVEDYDQNYYLPFDIKGFSNYISNEGIDYNDTKHGRYPIYKANDATSKESMAKIATLWRDLGDSFISEVPAVYPSHNGNLIVLDYGFRLYVIDMKKLRSSSLYLENIPSKYSKYISQTVIKSPEDISVPRSNHFEYCFFKVRRYIDTLYAVTSDKYIDNYYRKVISEIDLNDLTGRSAIKGNYSINGQLYQYYIDEYYAWNLINQSLLKVSENEYLNKFIAIETEHFTDEQWEKWEQKRNEEEKENEKILGPGQWQEYNDEDYVMIAESYGQTSSLFRSGYSEKYESVNLKGEKYHTTLYYNNSILVRNANKSTYCIIPSQTSNISDQDYLKDPNILINTNVNGEIHLWKWQSKPSKPVLSFIGSGNNLFALTPDFYYMGLTPVADKISFTKNGVSFGFEQFDLKFNRPDIVLERLGFAEKSLIKAYHQAYLKRLKKMNFTEDMLQDDFHLPELKIENFEKMPTIIEGDELDLNLNIKDTKYPLDRINVWINDVAIYGTQGIDIRDKQVKEYKAKLNLKLAQGSNKIQVSVLNQAGAESYKETFTVNCKAGKEKPNLYVVAIGVSTFEQSQYNLKFAAKDAEDIAKVYANNKNYGKVVTKTLTNQEVSKENIEQLREFLKAADINDEVIVFFAGHGVLDAQLDYYLASYDMDFNNPAAKGIAYENLERLLDGIAPLKKTLLIDACHSGEIDKDEVAITTTTEVEEGDVKFRNVGNTVTQKESHLGLQNTSELTKSLFADLRKGTGATVISSAGGMEFAMESSQWQNGLFTYCFINGLQSKEADLNKDGVIMLSELQHYVATQVTKLSNGKQQPTSRIENNVMDWKVW